MNPIVIEYQIKTYKWQFLFQLYILLWCLSRTVLTRKLEATNKICLKICEIVC